MRTSFSILKIWPAAGLAAAAAVVVSLTWLPATAAAAKTTLAVTPAAASCTPSAENPHYSSGAGGVIYKTRVTCNAKATVTFHGTLATGPQIGPLVPRATTTQTATVAAGGTATFYTPPSGKTGVFCQAGLYYQGYGSITVSGGATTNYQSNRVTVTC